MTLEHDVIPVLAGILLGAILAGIPLICTAVIRRIGRKNCNSG